MSELELDRAVAWLISEAGLQLLCGAPEAAYREMLGRKAEIDYTYKQQTGATGQFARVKLVFEPGEPGCGFVFESKIVGDAMPKEYIPGVEKGIEDAKDYGLLAGFPLIDFKATLIDGAYHDIDSSVLAFEIASHAAFKELREKGSPKLLQPIMTVEVTAPAAFVRFVTADLAGRRADIRDVQQGEGEGFVAARAPLANMFGYANDLSGITHGAGRFDMRFDHYEAVDMLDTPPDTFPAAAALRA